ncbi:MAG: GDP-mannose 4,6-dehydratase [Enterocloster sp.]
MLVHERGTMKKILIFGCMGFVGKYLSEEFLKHGYQVYGSDLSTNVVLNEAVKVQEADLLDAQRIEEVIRQCLPDYIVNLAAISSVALSWKIPRDTLNINVNGTLNILEAVRRNDIKCKILLIGSSEEYKKSNYPLSESCLLAPSNPYGVSKVMQEELARLYKTCYRLDIVCTRTFNHTGVGQPDRFVIPSFVKQIADIRKSKDTKKCIYM